MIGRAVQFHPARVRFDGSRANLHQRAFAGSVLADQRKHFTGGDFYSYVLQRHSRPEALGYPLHLEPDHRFVCVYSFSHFLKSGSSRFFIFGSSMFSGVATAEPVSMRFSTFWPCR